MSINPTYEREGKADFLVKAACILLIASVGLFIFINIKIRPFVVSVAKGYAVNLVSNALNEIIEEEFRLGDYEFINFVKDSEGRVVAATMNSADINTLMTKISIGLTEKIEDMEEIEANIPLGNFFPYPFLAGIGPEVRVKFLILSNTSITAEEKFEAKGINQTLYTISFQVKTVVGIYIPTIHSSVPVENSVPISQTLIVGLVPDTYTNVEGLEGPASDYILDL